MLFLLRCKSFYDDRGSFVSRIFHSCTKIQQSSLHHIFSVSVLSLYADAASGQICSLLLGDSGVPAQHLLLLLLSFQGSFASSLSVSMMWKCSSTGGLSWDENGFRRKMRKKHKQSQTKRCIYTGAAAVGGIDFCKSLTKCYCWEKKKKKKNANLSLF